MAQTPRWKPDEHAHTGLQILSHQPLILFPFACRGDPPRLPWSAVLRLSGWQEWRKRFIGSLKSMYTLAKLKRHLKPWSLPQFKARLPVRAHELVKLVCWRWQHPMRPAKSMHCGQPERHVPDGHAALEALQCAAMQGMAAHCLCEVTVQAKILWRCSVQAPTLSGPIHDS